MRYYGVATRGIVLGDRGDVDDARAISDLLRCPKSPSQCLIVRCRPSDGRASLRPASRVASTRDEVRATAGLEHDGNTTKVVGSKARCAGGRCDATCR